SEARFDFVASAGASAALGSVGAGGSHSGQSWLAARFFILDHRRRSAALTLTLVAREAAQATAADAFLLIFGFGQFFQRRPHTLLVAGDHVLTELDVRCLRRRFAGGGTADRCARFGQRRQVDHRLAALVRFRTTATAGGITFAPRRAAKHTDL